MTKAEATVVLHYGERQVSFYLPERETDHIQRYIASRGEFYEQGMLSHLQRLLEPGDLVIDVGANIGNHTLFFAAVCSARVWSFEPSARSAELLEANVALNGLSDSVQLHRTGLGRKKAWAVVDEGVADGNRGATSLRVGAARPDDSCETVAVAALDDFDFTSPPRLIKVDVEGMEVDVLHGAVETLKRFHPLLYVECANNAALADVLAELMPLGYRPVAQFNATPTFFFAPPDFYADSNAAAAAYGRMALGKEFGRVGERLRGLDRKLDTGSDASEAHTQSIADLQRSILEIAARVGGLTEEIAVLRAISEETVAGVRKTEPAFSMFASSADALNRTQRGLFTEIRDQSSRLARLEANSHTLLTRMQQRTRLVAEAPAPTQLTAKRNATSGGPQMSAVRRKFRKFGKDPAGFVRDMRNPTLRTVAAALLRTQGR